MKNIFVKTQNVKNFVSLMDTLQKLPPNIPRLALVYGEHGLGKTNAIIWWATRNDAIYVRANNGMTQTGLLKSIVDELGIRSYHGFQDNFNVIIKALQKEPRIIIVDEVDYLIGGKNTIEILRDIQDNTGTPIVLVGMGYMDKKISRYKHFEDRIYKKLQFEHFNQNDIKDIVEQLCEIEFTEDGIQYLSTRTNQFRQLVKIINKVEKLSKTNNISVLDEYTLKGLLNERKTPATMQKIEKMFA